MGEARSAHLFVKYFFRFRLSSLVLEILKKLLYNIYVR